MKEMQFSLKKKKGIFVKRLQEKNHFMSKDCEKNDIYFRQRILRL